MSKSALTALYFVLTFLAGVAVGSWVLWIYLIGFPSREAQPAPVAEVQSPPPSASAPQPSAPTASKEVPSADQIRPTAEAAAAPAPTPTPKGHWQTVDTPPRSHEECLALAKELNDAYKDCRFGVHKDVWVPE